MKFIKFYTLIILCLIVANCSDNKTETAKSINDTVHTAESSEKATHQNSQIDSSEIFATDAFSVEVPQGFSIQPSMVSPSSTSNYDSYFFVSPDQQVKFYVYVPKSMALPNDIIFPNEKIPVSYTKMSDSIIRTWRLEPNQQIPYYRNFKEVTTDDQIIIAGFYFKDEDSYEKYEDKFVKFLRSLQQ